MIQQNEGEQEKINETECEWTQQKIDQLREMVLGEKIYEWEVLEKRIGKNIQEVKNCWQSKIYKTIQIQQLIGGSRKWSHFEDNILRNHSKIGSQKWQKISVFLPSRSPLSIQARWKRISSKTDRLACKQVPPSMQVQEVQYNPSIQSPVLKTQSSPYDHRKQILLNYFQKFNLNNPNAL